MANHMANHMASRAASRVASRMASRMANYMAGRGQPPGATRWQAQRASLARVLPH